MEEAVTYYANILMPFSPLIVKKIQEVVAMELPNRHYWTQPRYHLAQRPHENRQRLHGLVHRQNRQKQSSRRL